MIPCPIWGGGEEEGGEVPRMRGDVWPEKINNNSGVSLRSASASKHVIDDMSTQICKKLSWLQWFRIIECTGEFLETTNGGYIILNLFCKWITLFNGLLIH